jgi:hypothetical protein
MIIIVYYCKLLIVGEGVSTYILWTPTALILGELKRKEANVYAFMGYPPSLI